MIELVTSHRIEALADALSEALAARHDALEPAVILVPNRPMERLVELAVAQRLGVAAHLRFDRLEGYVARWAEARLGTATLDGAALEGRLLARLVSLGGAALEDDALADLGPVARWLSPRAAGDEAGRLGGASNEALGAAALERRALGLARRVARLFVEYGYARPELIETWASARSAPAQPALDAALTRAPFADLARWQRALYRAARGEDDADTGARAPRPFGEILGALAWAGGRAQHATTTALSEAHAPTVHVFGVSYAARAFHRALGHLAREGPVRVYALNPCREFWEDAESRGEAARRLRRETTAGGVPAPRLDEDAHPVEDARDGDAENALLASWGRPGREHLASLYEHAGWVADERFDTEATRGAESVLAATQRAILERAPTSSRLPPLADGSITALACPSARREVERVVQEIWAWVTETPRALAEAPRRFSDVAVLVHGAERERYLPHLEAVFAEAHGVPWSALDLPFAARSRVAQGALRLVAWLRDEPTRARLGDVLAHPACRARLSPGEPRDWLARLDAVGFFRGLDARSGDRPPDDAGPASIDLAQALRRLALGAALGGGAFVDDPHDGAHALLPEAIQPDDEDALSMLALVRSLASDAHFAASARLELDAWARFFDAALRAYLVPEHSSDEADLAQILRALEALRARHVTGARYGVGLACDLFVAELEGLTSGRGSAHLEGVTVASLLPMRAIPFRLVFVLGLSEGSFPGRDDEAGLDLRAASRRAGDVSVDERDRYTFLETLLSARERLVVSWIARDEATGDPIAPASVVSELAQELGDRLRVERPALRRHDDALDAAGTADALRTRASDDGTDLARAWRLGALPCVLDEARARVLGDAERTALGEGPLALSSMRLAPDDDPRRALLRWPRVASSPQPSPERGEPPACPSERVGLGELRAFVLRPMQAAATRALGGRVDEAPDLAESEPLELAPHLARRLTAHALLAHREGSTVRAAVEGAAAALRARGRFPLGTLGTHTRTSLEAQVLAFARTLSAHVEPGPLAPIRVGAGGLGSYRTRLPALALRGKTAALELSGDTAWLAPDGHALVLLDHGGDDDETPRDRALRLVAERFVDHAVLAASGLGQRPTDASRAANSDASLDARRVLVVAHDGVHEARFAGLAERAARAWLRGLSGELLHGHASFLPFEAVATVLPGLARDREHLADLLGRALERVRARSEGGSERHGPIRDALARPDPDLGERARILERRFGPLARALMEPPRAARGAVRARPGGAP